jgi:hypothetical protein
MDKISRIILVLTATIVALTLLCEGIIFLNTPLLEDHPIIRKGPAPYKNASEESSPFAALRAASLVMYKTGGGQCSGTMIAPHLFLTAKHCVAAEMVVFKADGHSFPAVLLKASHEADVVLLSTEADCPCVPVGKTQPVVDTKIVSVGFPRYSDLRVQVIEEGRVQGYGAEWMVTTTAVIPGKSGGGIFQQGKTGEWELVGVMSAYLNGEPPVYVYGLSVKFEEIARLVEGVGK